MQISQTTKNKQGGFTIVELMIAISVLAVILLVVTLGIIQISKTYYKGIIQSTTQQTARTILDDVTQSIQYDSVRNLTEPGIAPIGILLSDGSSYKPQSYCIGQTTRYSYVLGYQLSATKDAATTGDLNYSRHALWKDGYSSGCAPVNLSTAVPPSGAPFGNNGGGHELLGQNMRLTRFTIKPVSVNGKDSDTLYKVSITVMYGDDDLFDKSSGSMEGWKCTSSAGVFATAFCAKSELTTVVGKRLS